MKSLIYLIVLSVTTFFAACSSNEQDVIPFAPQLEKKGDRDINHPYRYLQSFREAEEVITRYTQDESGVALYVNTGTQNIKHMYAMLELHGNPVLVFLGNSEKQKFFIKGLKSSRDFKIRIFGSLKDDTQINPSPYLSSTLFRNIPVKGWSASNRDIKVSSTEFPTGLVHLFAELKTKAGNYIVFLARPKTEDFEIPKYGELGVDDIRLFGYVKDVFTKDFK